MLPVVFSFLVWDNLLLLGFIVVVSAVAASSLMYLVPLWQMRERIYAVFLGIRRVYHGEGGNEEEGSERGHGPALTVSYICFEAFASRSSIVG